jgi:hypothetical protein
LAFIKELEIPNVKDLIELDFKSSKNLKKVKIHANFSPKKPLPSWIKVTQISFDPSKTQDWINLEYTSKSAVILDSEEFPDYQEPFDLSNIAEMKNLESLHFICWLKHTRDLEFFMPPKLKTLQSNCPKINSLKLGIHWCCNIVSVIDLLQEHLPQISMVDIYVPLRYLGIFLSIHMRWQT